MNRPKRPARSVARLAAVQALYQMDIAGLGAEAVIREFHDHRFDRDLDGDAGSGESRPLAPADEAWFALIVRGVTEAQGEVDRKIRKRLASGWKLERIDATARAILRAAAFELLAPDAPVEVVIDEYVEIAKSFFEGPEPGFVNAALDGIAADAKAG
ncbi:MAG TPA: transcription antitermination factor NusB [Caulobacteraceae bacterium]